jgi:Phage tail fibre repeat./Carbohydrate binding domain.
MIIQNKPDYLIFADSAKKGENAEFPDVSRGWGVTIDQTASKPPMEWMNGAFNRIDKNMMYLLQQGVPEWSEQVTYPANAIIKYNGVLYTAIVENDNAIPTTSTTKWKKTQEEIPNASLFQKGVVKLNSEINSESETEAATPKAIKKVCDLANNQVPNIRKINNKTLNTDIVLQADDVNALPAIRKFDNNIPIYEVDVNLSIKCRVGEQWLSAFRANELPFGCYFRNGDNFLLNSPQGQVLNSFSDNYKLDHGISIKTINGQQYINVPNAFHSDGRGYFERAVNGTTRQVGSIENDAIRNITGQFLAFMTGDNALFTIGKRWVGDSAPAAISKANGMSFNVFDASRVVPTGPENRVLNTGRTPVIYLGI